MVVMSSVSLMRTALFVFTIGGVQGYSSCGCFSSNINFSRGMAMQASTGIGSPSGLGDSSSIVASGGTSVDDRASVINIKLDGVKNMRDLCSASPGLVKGATVFRTGCVSNASSADVALMKTDIDFKCLVDLRSPAELHDDEELHAPVYEGFSSFSFERAANAFVPATHIIPPSSSSEGGSSRARKPKSVSGAAAGGAGAAAAAEYSASEIATEFKRKRVFVSLMSEDLIKKGVFFRLRKRVRAKAIAYAMLSTISRRAEKKMKGIFLNKINGGGLSLLNELVIDASGPELVSVLKLVAEPQNHPIGIYCTAGKDRTGLVAMLILSVLGVSDDDILADYVLSDSAYKDINNKKAMVAALQQADVDPDLFLGARPEVMQDTLNYIRTMHGSIQGFLEEHGFDAAWRDKLRTSLTCSAEQVRQ